MSDEADALWDELIDHEFQTFVGRATGVSELVHYTSFVGLKGIVETEELWFSSASTTNDIEEISRGKAILERNTAPGGPLHGVLDSIRQLAPAFWNSLSQSYRNRQFGDFFHTYISCWSECELSNRSHDNLTMWRGYAADGNGVAIVVDATKLAAQGSVPSEIVMCPVFYEGEANFIVRAEAALNSYRVAMAKNLNALSRHTDLFANAFSELCFYLALTHKHPGFASEREWRFTWSKHRNPTATGLSRYLRPVLLGDNLIEKFCFPIKSDKDVTLVELDIRDLVKSVMIGPCKDIVLKRDAVVNLLASKGFQNPGALVTYTEIPYRSLR
jgi:hypothetical protein